MTNRIDVKLKNNSYAIMVGQGIILKLPNYLATLNLGKDAVIITHPKLKRLYGEILTSVLSKAGYAVHFICVPEGEKSKSAHCAISVVEHIAKIDIHKNIFCIAFGGGVIGDLTGFVAAIYKRGIPYIQVPTSLLAQVDSAIGGKTAIDLSVGKNLVGAFYQPKLVLSDIKFLQSLSVRQVRNGLAEVIKYGVIDHALLLAFVVKHSQELLQSKLKALETVVLLSSRIKSSVVSLDEFETRGIRSILNFGHTFGHAIEAAGGFSRYQHGESVALGMRMACRLSVLLGKLSTKNENEINNALCRIGLPKRVTGISKATILKHMQHDKKFVGKKNRFVIALRIGESAIVENISQALITQSMDPFLAP